MLMGLMFQEIEVSCKNGYSDAVGDNGKKGIRCTSTGYTGYIRRCVGPYTRLISFLEVYCDYYWSNASYLTNLSSTDLRIRFDTY